MRKFFFFNMIREEWTHQIWIFCYVFCNCWNIGWLNLCFIFLFSPFFFKFETAAAEVLASLKMKVDNEEPKTEEVQILLTSKEDSMSMRSIGVSGFGFLFYAWLTKEWRTWCFIMLLKKKKNWWSGSIYFKTGEDIWDYNSCFQG